MKRILSLVLVLVVLLSVSLTTAQDLKTLNIAFVQDIDTLNFGLYSSQYFSSILTTLWNSPPWVFDTGLNAIPRLVTEIPSVENGGVSEDGRTITLTLRDDIVWSDGEAITADDFVFTYDMYMSDANAVDSRSPYDLMESVVAADAQTVVVTFNELYAPWMTSLFSTVMPQHVLQPIFDADGTLDNADYNRLPSVGSGPFIPTDWQVGNYILFERNENYFDGQAALDQIYVRFVPDDAAQVAALINGDMDMGIFIAPDDARTLQENGVNVVAVNSGYNEGVYFNFREDRPIGGELAVRQAFAMGINMEQIAVDLLSYGAGPEDHLDIADTFWHNTAWANPDIAHHAYDPEGAAALLEAAGWVDSDGDGIREKDGQPLHLTWATTDRTLRVQVQQVAQQQLAEIGMDVELVNLPSDLFFASYGDGGPVPHGEYDLWEYSGNPDSFPDPNDAQWSCAEIPSDDNPAGSNDQAVCNEELDALIAQQAATADAEARRAIFFEIQQIMHDNLYFIPLWHDPDLWALSARFQNADIAPTLQFWNAVNWDVTS